jgi:hypothetical protein
MRICDVLLKNLIEDSVNLDHKNSIGKKTQTKNCVNELETVEFRFPFGKTRLKMGGETV